MVTLGQLWARQELALDVVVDSPHSRLEDVTIVHSSELPAVDEWLAGERSCSRSVSAKTSAATAWVTMLGASRERVSTHSASVSALPCRGRSFHRS